MYKKVEWLLVWGLITIGLPSLVSQEVAPPPAHRGILLQADSGYQWIIEDTLPQVYAKRFWVEGAVWFPPQVKPGGEVYYLFRIDSIRNPRLWCAGYSFKQKELLLGKFAILDTASGQEIHIQKIGSKPVEIIPPHNKLYFKLIFYGEENRIKFEVNGVPLEIPFSFPRNSLKYLGFCAGSQRAEFEPLKMRGD